MKYKHQALTFCGCFFIWKGGHMTTLRIIDTNFTPINEITLYQSLQITNRFHDVGQIELKINRYVRGANELLVDRIIFTEDNTSKAFVIVHREIALDENGKDTENWNIKALSLKSWLAKRIILPPSHTANQNKSGPTETVMKHYVNISAVNPTDVKRKIPKLVIATDLARGDTISRSARFDTLSEELATISTLTGVGWNVSVDITNKQFVFDVVIGANKTATQRELPPIIFSPEWGTIESLEYTESKLDYKNMAYVAGQGEGIERRVITLNDNATGHDRYELYVDARDVSETDDESTTGDGEAPQRPTTEIVADLTERGTEKLIECEQVIYFGGQIISSQNFVYERDWSNGDIVTLQHEGWGIGADARITEVKEIHESGNPMKLEVVFDNDKPTLIDKIKREFKSLNPIVKT